MIEDTRQKGFTLIELMVAIAISGMLMAVVAMAYTGQSRSNNAVQDMASLQQDLRSALQLMAREIRMAGYNPDKISGAASPQFLTATATTLQFSQDTNGDGDTLDANEIVRFALSGTAPDTSLGRATGVAGVLMPMATNIDQLAFEYLLEDETWTQAPADLTDIRAVRIVVLGHSARGTAGSTDSSTFTPPLESVVPAPDWTPATPGRFHWRMMSLIVQCRNLNI
jgi:type IV pilus assembly protein PilW